MGLSKNKLLMDEVTLFICQNSQHRMNSFIHPFFFERESKIPLAAFYLFEVPILIGIRKAILEYSFSKNFEK